MAPRPHALPLSRIGSRPDPVLLVGIAGRACWRERLAQINQSALSSLP